MLLIKVAATKRKGKPRLSIKLPVLKGGSGRLNENTWTKLKDPHPPGALYPRFRTWWGPKPAHQAHFCRVFAPGANVRLGKDFVRCFEWDDWESSYSLITTTRRTLPPISHLVEPKTSPPGALLPGFRTWWIFCWSGIYGLLLLCIINEIQKYLHNLEICTIFVPK